MKVFSKSISAGLFFASLVVVYIQCTSSVAVAATSTFSASKTLNPNPGFYGCGLAGEDAFKAGAKMLDPATHLPSNDDTRKWWDALRATNKYGPDQKGLISFWDWSLSPQDVTTLSPQIMFMPELWGVSRPDDGSVEAPEANEPGNDPQLKYAAISDIAMAANEPDMGGFCMDNEPQGISGWFGHCSQPCIENDPPVDLNKGGASTCPIPTAGTKGVDFIKSKKWLPCYTKGTLGPTGAPLEDDIYCCGCGWNTEATGVGFWPVGGNDCRVNRTECDTEHQKGCAIWTAQPLANLFPANMPPCSAEIPTDGKPTCTAQGPQGKPSQGETCMNSLVNWSNKQYAGYMQGKGYQYLSTPLFAVNMNFMIGWMQHACGTSCDPATLCKDEHHQCTNPDDLKQLMGCGCPTHLAFHYYGTGCEGITQDPNYFKDLKHKVDVSKNLMETYPHLRGTIVNEIGVLQGTDTSPNCQNLVTFLETALNILVHARTEDGRSVIAGLNWFNLPGDGGTYDLRLYDDDGAVNKLGHAYQDTCTKAIQDGWGVKGSGPTSSLVI
jgi:hypothetical protein